MHSHDLQSDTKQMKLLTSKEILRHAELECLQPVKFVLSTGYSAFISMISFRLVV